MTELLDIYARAARGQALTPPERAVLRTISGLWQAALAAGAIAILQAALRGGAPLTFATLGQIGAVAVAAALITGAAKLVSASGDPLLAGALAQAAGAVTQRFQPPDDVAAEPPTPAITPLASTTPASAASGAASASKDAQTASEPSALPAPAQDDGAAATTPAAPEEEPVDVTQAPTLPLLPAIAPSAPPSPVEWSRYPPR
jgi:hypothetical protein